MILAVTENGAAMITSRGLGEQRIGLHDARLRPRAHHPARSGPITAARPSAASGEGRTSS